MIKQSSNLLLLKILSDCESRIRALPNGDDIFQDVCVKCLELSNREKHFKISPAYVYRMASNANIDTYRRNQIRASESVDLHAESITDEETPLLLVMKDEAKNILHREIQRLPSEQKKVLELRFFHALCIDEVVIRLGIPPTTVKSRQQQALYKLRNSPVLSGFRVLF